MKIELVFTAYNRPYYLEPVINSWNKVRGLQEIPATFFIEPSDQYNDIINSVFNLNTEVSTISNQERVGVLTNPWNALNTAFENGADFTILAEDDVIVSEDTLEFFNWAAIEYQTSYKTLCVNAFSRLGSGKDNQVTSERSFSPLVWGVWKDRWETILKDSWDKDYSTGNTDGSEAGWDWNINRILQFREMNVLKPVNSRSDHIGEHAGTHMTPDVYDSSRGIDFQLVRGRQRYNEV